MVGDWALPFSRGTAHNQRQRKTSLCASREAVRIALNETQREEARLRSLHSAVVLETSHISRDDRFAVAN